MCGLNFILDKNSVLPPEAVTRMNKATRHRGPDSSAFFAHRTESSTLFFGHNRLKIIDCTDAANQPFISSNGRYILIYNGEIYNYLSLRQRLQQQGIHFRTNSDAEVLLYLLVEEGVKGLAKLNGMFALVFYDTVTDTILAARDRFGLKPLYYTETPDFLLFSSEIKGILAANLVPKELNESQIINYLTSKHACKPETFYKNIFELEEGKFGIYRNGEWKIQTYLSPVPHEKTGNFDPDKLINRTEELLQNSLARQLQADVPVGLFLSGGVDSTLLLALLADAGYQHFPAFSVVNRASERNFGSEDFHFSRLAAEQFGAKHHVFEIDETILHDFEHLVEKMDQPIADGAALLTSFLSKNAHGSINVALSGAGADELFGGYNRHRAFYQYLKHRNLLLLAKPFLRVLSSVLPTGLSHPWRKQFRLIHKLGTKIHKNPERTFLHFTAMDVKLRRLLKAEAPGILSRKSELSNTKNDWLHWALEHDQHEYLISDVLALTDQASMRHSLEVRTPYLDNELQNFVSGLQPELLFRDGQKWVLKELLNRHGGEQFIDRQKEGFGMPLGSWLKNPQNDWLLEPLYRPGHMIFHYLDFNQTQKMLNLHKQNRHDFSVEIWALLTLAYWLGKNFGA